jgi:hypothetical protein
MMNKVIANMFRLFHSLLWILVLGGILVSKSLRVNYLCTVFVFLGILLWEFLGYCFVSVLENQFDPVRENTGEVIPDHANLLYGYVSNPEFFGKAFNCFIYLVLFIGLYRTFSFLRTTTTKTTY